MKNNNLKSLKAALSINLLIGLPLLLIPEELRALIMKLFTTEADAFIETADFRLFGGIMTLVSMLMLLSRKLLSQKYQDILLAGIALVNGFAAFELSKWLLQYKEFLMGYIGTLEKYGILGLLGLSLFALFRTAKYLANKYLGKQTTNNPTNAIRNYFLGQI